MLRVGGELDLFVIPLLAAALDANLDHRPDHLLVDFTRVSYCCIRGLDVLVRAADHAADQGVGYAVSGLPARIDRIWQIFFHDRTPVRYPSAAEAVSAIQARQAAPVDRPGRRSHLRSVPEPCRHRQRESSMIRVMVVDDHAFMRNAIAALLTTAGDIAVVGRCANGAEALSMLPEVWPDVILMDVSMPVLDGIQITSRLRAACPDTRVVILTASLHGNAVPGGCLAGVVDYQPDSVDPADLIEVVRAAHAGGDARDTRADTRADTPVGRWTEPLARPDQKSRL